MVSVTVLLVAALCCSACFVQVTVQAGPKQQPCMTQRQASGMLTVPAKVAAAAPRELATTAPAQAGKKPKRTTTRRRAAAAAAAVVAPPPKYPALDKLKNASWDVAERVNRADESGKLVVRAVRNGLSGALTEPAFWAAAAAVTGKLGKWTNDARKADLRVRMCDAAARALTRPAATVDYERVAEQVYQAAASVDVTPYAELALDAVDAVEHDELLRALAGARRAVDAVDLDPAMVTKAFNLVNRFLGKTGLVTVNDGVTNGITKLGMILNRNAGKRQS